MKQGPYEAQVAANLRGLRAARGISAQQLADLITHTYPVLNRRVISKIENGERGVSVDDLAALAAVFDLQPGDLLTPQCEVCHGAPPDGFTCNRCGQPGRPA